MVALSSWLIYCFAGLLPSSSPALVDQEMVSWAAARVPADLPAERRLQLLHRALIDRSGLSLGESARTATARQAFAERKANCVAFAFLYLGLARRLGVPAYFVLARGIEKEGRQRNLRILEGHMAIGFGASPRAVVVDAGGLQLADSRRFERISDRVAEAIFYSNRGAEALLDRDGPNAVAWLEQATQRAPEVALLWLNLGVARRRSGDLLGAALARAEATRLQGSRSATGLAHLELGRR